jgi:hypothetical protein
LCLRGEILAHCTKISLARYYLLKDTQQPCLAKDRAIVLLVVGVVLIPIIDAATTVRELQNKEEINRPPHHDQELE